MKQRSTAFLLMVAAMVLLLAVAGQAQSQSFATRHVREAVSQGRAQKVGELPASQMLRFDIVLPLHQRAQLEKFLKEVYDPASPNYRHFLTPKQFAARFGSTQKEYDEVMQFAKANGFNVVGGSRDSRNVQFTARVANIQKAFHVTMGVYKHPTEDRTFFAPDREPTVDLSFQPWHVSGLDNYSIPQPQWRLDSAAKANEAVGSCPDAYYCASDMRAAYYPEGTLTGTGQNIALLELAGTDLADLNTYYKSAGQTQPYTPTLISTGGYSTNCLASNYCEDAEQTLDMTQAMGMAPGSKMLYMYVCGDAYGKGTFSDTACLSAMVTTEAAPLSMQISSSWAWLPADPTSDDPYFEQMAAQGQSFFQAAGDSGAYSSINPVDFPSDDAYVTVVGGTDLITNGAGGGWSSETAWLDGGGGASTNSIAIPSWQHLDGVITSTNGGSTVYRNSPDVAAEANSDFFICYDQSGCTGGAAGTSFAAPMWAGFMALANQQAVANGGSAIGFINPIIYPVGVGGDYGFAFHDIISGGNGYWAVPGYDLATGWGSPTGTGTINALLGVKAPGFELSLGPSSLTLQQGTSGTSVITINDYDGFTGNVALSISGLPDGITAKLSTKHTKSTSTLTLKASSQAIPGSYLFTVSGASGSITNDTSIALEVTRTPDVTFKPTSLTFPSTKVGTTSAPQTITVSDKNGGLDITSIAASGDFAVSSSSCGSTLAAGSKCQVLVTFTPKAKGQRTGSLTFTDNALSSPQSIALSGSGS